MKDGWHTIAGYKVYVEDGKIKRGITDDGEKPIYVYRWNKKLECWTAEGDITQAAFQAGVRRETITMK